MRVLFQVAIAIAVLVSAAQAKAQTSIDVTNLPTQIPCTLAGGAANRLFAFNNQYDPLSGAIDIIGYTGTSGVDNGPYRPCGILALYTGPISKDGTFEGGCSGDVCASLEVDTSATTGFFCYPQQDPSGKQPSGTLTLISKNAQNRKYLLTMTFPYCQGWADDGFTMTGVVASITTVQLLSINQQVPPGAAGSGAGHGTTDIKSAGGVSTIEY